MDVQTYLLHSGLILTLLSIFYWLLLRRETFFKVNRWLLLGNIILALAIPLLPKPAYVIQLKADLVESFQPAVIESPVVSAQENIPIKNTSFNPSNEAMDLGISPVEVVDTKPAPISSINLLNSVYLIGFCIMLFRFLIQIHSVYRQIKRSEVTKGAGYYLATNNKDIAPFSFWNYIVINPNKYDETSFIQILEHERIHIIQRHTFDLVLAELFLIVQWFNPLAWWHRYLVGQNLEFLVDQTLLDNGENKQAYQYHLVQVAVPNSPLSISSNYNASQLKNRIKMMNLQRSSLAASWKYALLLPVAFMLLVAFTTEAIPNSLQKEQKTELDALYVIITEDAKIAEIKENQEKLLAYGVNLIFEDLQYDKENKIEVLKTVMHVDKTFGSANWTKEKQGFKSIILYKDWRNQRLGTGFSEELLNVVENRPENSKVFVISGNNDIAQTMAQLKVAARKANEDLLAKQQKLQADPAWKGEWFKESTNFSECSTYMLEQLKMEFLNSTKTTYTFRVNGIEWDERALEIPAESIGAYTVTDEGYALPNEQGFPSRKDRKVTKRAINIIRKAQNIPRTESQETNLEEIYIILTEEASLEEIMEAQKEMLDLGINLQINYCQNNVTNTKIEKIAVQFEANGNTHNVSWGKDNIGYNFMVLGINKKTGKTFGGQGKGLLKQLSTNNTNRKLITYGIGNTYTSIEYLQKQIAIREELLLIRQQNLAKSPNLKNSSSSTNTTYVNITKLLIKEIKNRIKEAKPLTINYYIDGVKEGPMVLDIPTKQIKEIKWNEENLTKYDKKGEIRWEYTEQLNIFVSRKAKQEKPKAKKGYQYFKECDCYIPKTFNPNGGKNKFKIEGANFDENSKIDIYNKWGKVIYKSEPFTNDWDGMITTEESVKEGTYFFIFQATLYSEVAKGYIRILDGDKRVSSDFVHQADSTHYIIIPCTAENFDQAKDFIRPSLFMLGGATGKKRFSSIYLGSDKSKPIFIIRKFDNFEQTEHYIKQLEKLSGQPENLDFLSISQHNYRTLLKNKSLDAYKEFYQKLVVE